MNDERSAAFDPDSTQVVLRPGLRWCGRYTLVRKLGAGGMGVVWLARDEKLEREVALKFLPDLVREDPEALRDLKIEVRRCLALTHEHIVRVYDLVEDALAAAIAMEYVPGRSLAARKAAQPHGCFDPAELAPLVAQLCAALDYAHTRARIVHRDLKPANLLVTDAGVLKIADFGIARSLSETQTRLTRDARSSAATLSFAGPQQLDGADPSPADDLYALGATLYDLLTGKPPFFRGEVLSQIHAAAPEPLAARREKLGNTGAPIPRAWEETIFACLAKRAEDRPAGAGEVARRLGIVTGAGVAAPTPGTRAPLDPDATERILPSAGLRADSHLPREDDSATRARPDRGARRPARWRWLALGGAAAAAAIFAAIFWPRAAPPEVAPASSRPPTLSRQDAGATEAATRANQIPESSSKISAPPAALVPAPSPAPAPQPLPREFTVTVDPPDAGARLWLDRASDITVPPDGRVVVRDLGDGEPELIVQAPGYQPLTMRVTVKDGRGAAEVKLVPVRGALEIAARPGTVVTAVDARGRETRLGTVSAAGTLAADNLLTIGRYTVRLAHPDCAPAEAPAELVIGRTVKLAPAQTPLPGELRVFSVPDGAEVSINGRKLGVTPATLRDQPSEVPLTLEVYARGHRRATQTHTLKPKEVRTVPVGTLAAESGALELRLADAALRSDPKLTVRVDGHPVGPALAAGPLPLPLTRDGLELGEHVVEVTHPDYEPFTQRIAIRDQETARVDVRLTPKPATLVLAFEGAGAPRDYTLKVDGQSVGPALAAGPGPANGTGLAVTPEARPQGPALRYRVPAQRELALELTAPGYKPMARKITLPANDTFTWPVALEKIRGPEPGQPWTIPDLNLTLLPIAAGTFTMGSENGGSDEKPLTRVTLTQPFWLGRTEVTQREWQAVMGSNPSARKGENLPVERVSWEEAMEFCRKLSARERAADRLPAGYAYTLPTEAQWEYACRAGTTGDYAGPLGDMAWYSENSGDATHAVATKRANAWGLHDMHGNVWEWCADWYGGYGGGTVRDPMGATSGTLRVLRGGSWGYTADICRSAYRDGWEPGFRLDFLGFRLALSSVR